MSKSTLLAPDFLPLLLIFKIREKNPKNHLNNYQKILIPTNKENLFCEN